jgi:hypothetical protein
MSLWFRGGIGLALSLLALGQSDRSASIDPDLLVLARIKVVMAENLNRLPNYTCLQTIERSQRRGPKRNFQLVDTIRLEVGLVGGAEMFSWPGAGKFEERRLSDMVGGGTIGTGNFGIHARAIFLGNGPVFQKEGEVERDARRLLRFRYRVRRINSGYHIKVGDQQDVAGYFGSFDVDPDTLDLVHLEVNASEIPPNLPILSARDVMTYARVPIGGSTFLLPQSSELTMVSLDGSESRNRTQFTSCRQYTGESQLRFDDPPPLENVPAPPSVVPQVDLKPGERLDLRLESTIRFETAAVGDEVLARLTRDVKNSGRVLVPKGSPVHARITRVQKASLTRKPGMIVTLELTELEVPPLRIPIYATLEDAGPVLPGMSITFDRETSAVAVDRLELPRGLRMVWRIVPDSR